MVLVDSDVWSEAFRKAGPRSWAVSVLKELIENDEVVMIGPVRQEVLSGIKDETQFESIRNALKAFSSQPLDDSLFELAASYFNVCRSNGIQGTHTDFLICACSVIWDIEILTKDKDYVRYSNHLPISLLKLR